MSLTLILLLALVQGITEFLPISSSGHLVLIGRIGGNDQGALVDIALHVGTLAAVLVYFWADVRGMLLGCLDLVRGRRSRGGQLALKVTAATVPVVVAGFVLTRFAPDLFRSVEVIAWATIGFGILLFVADRWFPAERAIARLPYRDALVIGLSQVLALIPGTSRSGITMTAARFLGYARPEAARFSLLLSIPTIAAAGLLLGYDLYRLEDAQLTRDAVLAGFLAFFAALGAIALMMRWLRRASFTPFVVYRLVLGAVLLVYVYA